MELYTHKIVIQLIPSRRLLEWTEGKPRKTLPKEPRFELRTSQIRDRNGNQLLAMFCSFVTYSLLLAPTLSSLQNLRPSFRSRSHKTVTTLFTSAGYLPVTAAVYKLILPKGEGLTCCAAGVCVCPVRKRNQQGAAHVRGRCWGRPPPL
jgi:hypothetical protein